MALNPRTLKTDFNPGAKPGSGFTSFQGIAVLSAGLNIAGSLFGAKEQKRSIDDQIRQKKEQARITQLNIQRTELNATRLITEMRRTTNKALGANLARAGARGIRASGSVAVVQQELQSEFNLAEFFTASERNIQVREGKIRKANFLREVDELKRAKKRVDTALGLNILSSVLSVGAAIATGGTSLALTAAAAGTSFASKRQ